ALHEPEHTLAGLESGDAGADLGDDAGKVATDQPGIAGIEAEHIEHIPEVETCGLHPDLYVARGRWRHFCLGQTKVVDCTAFGWLQDVIGCSGYREMAAARPWQKTRHQVLSLSQCEFGFVGRCAE